MLNGPDEIVVRQKDMILQDVNECLTHDDDRNCMLISDYVRIFEVIGKLRLVCELWCNNNYKYKGQEIVQRLLNASRDTGFYLKSTQKKKLEIARKVIIECNHLLDNYR